jgi:transposase
LEFDRMIMAWHRSNQTSKHLHRIPGVGPMLATALVASVADPRTFRSGRNFSTWIGLVPRQHSSGGKDRLGSISKQGDRYLRGLFVARRGFVPCTGVSRADTPEHSARICEPLRPLAPTLPPTTPRSR